MSAGEVLSSIISGVAVLILASIARAVRSAQRDFRRVMAEHIWLITTTLWTRDKVTRIMAKLDMPIDDQPPADLPR